VKATAVNRAKEKQKAIDDPYGFYYDEEYIDDEDLKVEIDQDSHLKYDPRHFREYLDKEIFTDDIKSRKKEWLINGMKNDPAFMVDPVTDYYLQKIPNEALTQLSKEEVRLLVAMEDPVTWGEIFLLKKSGFNNKWSPRFSKTGIPYQSMIARTKSKRVALRAGRRCGKTAGVVVRMLHRAFTFVPKPGKGTYNIIVFTPNQSQIRTIFKMIELMIDGNPDLLSMIKEKGKIPTRQQPYMELEFTNGVTIMGFVSGSPAIRSKAADFLWLDEGSFLTSDDIDPVIALINEHKDVEFIVSSTPKGLKDWFYERVNDPSYVDFYFPSDRFHPLWDRKMEEELKGSLSSSGYSHEVLALFSGDGEGVFQLPFVEAAVADYSYSLQRPKEGWIYTMGVDWNDPENGTQIKIVGYDTTQTDPAAKRYRVVATESIHIEKWTQLTAIDKIIEMNRRWKCSHIYVDAGHGSTQIERLHQIASLAPPKSIDRRLKNVQGIGFKKSIEVYDPWSKQIVKKETKPFMVNHAVRIFENGLIEIPREDDKLIHQLEGYLVDRYTPAGVPVYKRDKKYGDHHLDALVLALLPFVLEYDQLGKPRMATAIAVTEAFHGYKEGQAAGSRQKEMDNALARDKALEQKEYDDSHSTSSIFGGKQEPLAKRGRIIARHKKVIPKRENSRIKF